METNRPGNEATLTCDANVKQNILFINADLEGRLQATSLSGIVEEFGICLEQIVAFATGSTEEPPLDLTQSPLSVSKVNVICHLQIRVPTEFFYH